MSSGFEAGLARLREQFRIRAAGERRLLQGFANDLAAGVGPEQRTGEIRRIAHGLSGLAGTLGYADVSARAAELEDAVLAHADAPILTDCCRALCREIETALGLDDPTVPAEPRPSLLDSARRRVWVFDGAESIASLLATLSNLGYDPVVASPRCGRGPPPQGLAAALITDAAPDALGLAARVSKHIPTLYLTGDRSFANRLAAARAGVEAVLALPVDVSEFGDWLDELCGPRRDTPLSVLIVDDDQLVAQAHGLALESAGMRTSIMTEPADVLNHVTASYPDLILMDVQMPGVDGIELARVIRQSRRHLSLPVVFLSAERDDALQMRARKVGGDDFITKPVDPERLVSLVRMRAERAVALRSVMERDSLTGLLNHARFKDRLAHELERCRRTGAAVSLAMIDLDHFKRTNDLYGHMTGDRVLRSLAHALTAGLRRIDVVGRYGGEEFGVILLDASAEAARATIDRIRCSFGAIGFEVAGRHFSTTFSAGVAGSRSYSTIEQLIAAADGALYRAKREGRNRTMVG